ncbi:MAG TPA: TauD/TfdA family dioxygenase [Novosphingobium sp.]|nr:TauD/TfdA family dioxygenase [Novosphingobium sp.]
MGRIQAEHRRSNDTAVLDIAPVAGRIGAEIRSVKLGGDLDDATVAAITAALVRYKVIFFRGQHHLDDDAHEAFAARMGQPLRHPTVPPTPGSKFLFPLDSKEGVPANEWHTDITFLPAFPAASILRAMVIPPVGGDTLWTNTATAYDDLPSSLRAMADTLRAVHSNAHDYSTHYTDASQQDIASKTSTFAMTKYETEHPVVHVHPVSGERALLLGGFVRKITGVRHEESARIYQLLQDQITRPENTVRWRWAVGDVAIWDNRSTQHRAIADWGDDRRVLRRATIAGQVPIGLDGNPSRVIAL